MRGVGAAEGVEEAEEGGEAGRWFLPELRGQAGADPHSQQPY